MDLILELMKANWNREERNKINRNWQKIMDVWIDINRQLIYITDGGFDELLLEINDAIAVALQAGENAEQTLSVVNAKIVELQQTVDAAISNMQSQVNETIDNANDTVVELTNNVNNAISNANAASDNANNAAIQALANVSAAILDLQNNIEEFKNTFNNLGNYQNTTQYYKNNEVLYLGSTWRAKQNVFGNPPPSYFATTSEYWQLVARRGDDAPSVDDILKVWRGASPPQNSTMIWWYDADYTVGEYVNIYRSDIPPTDLKQLWLSPRMEEQ